MTEHRDAEADATEDDFQLSRHDLNAIERAIDEGDGPLLDALLDPVNAADIADLIEQLTPQRRREFLQLYSGEIDGDILTEIDESIRDEVIEQLPAPCWPKPCARWTATMSST